MSCKSYSGGDASGPQAGKSEIPRAVCGYSGGPSIREDPGSQSICLRSWRRRLARPGASHRPRPRDQHIGAGRMTNDRDSSLEDLLPVLEANPLWEGHDEEFAAFVRTVFDVPPSITRITITRRTASRRSAVAIGGLEGAIVFILAPEGHGTRITPFLMGSIIGDANINRRAEQSDGEANAMAVTSLIIRHLGPDVAVALMAPSALNHEPTIVDEPGGVH